MRIPPPDHLALLLRARDGGYAYDTLMALAGNPDRPDLAEAEWVLAERDDELSLLAVATFGYSALAVQRTFERTASRLIHHSVAGNGFGQGSGWCGSVLNLDQATRLLRATPTAIAAFAGNPRISPDGLHSLLYGVGPSTPALARDHLRAIYAALANNPTIPKMLASASKSRPAAPVLRLLLSSLARCPVDRAYAEAAQSLLHSVWRQVDTDIMLPPVETLGAIAHWQTAPDSDRTGMAAFEVQQYLWAMSEEPPAPTSRDDLAKRVGAMMRLILERGGNEATLKQLLQIDSHAFYCALNHTPISRFRDATRQMLLDLLRNAPSDRAAFAQVYDALVDDLSPPAMERPLTRGEFTATADWLDSIVREIAPRFELLLRKASADREEGYGLSKFYALMLGAFGVVALAGLVLAIFVLAR